MKQERKILLRFDDICPTMNWEQWGRAKQLMDEAGVTALLGVIPDCQDPDLQIDEPRPDFWKYIRDLQSQGYSIAMHGYQHVFSKKANGIITHNKISEFAGLPYEEQLEKIRKGKDILLKYGINTDIFFAPAHSYDDNTLKALALCGFKYVSDGYSSQPYGRNGITLLPCRTGGIPNMKKSKGYVTAVMHAHEWIRPEKSHAWIKFQDLLRNYSSEIVSFDQFSYRKPSHFLQGWLEERFYIIREKILHKARVSRSYIIHLTR